MKAKNSRSPIWHYFEPIDVKNTKCLLCESTYRNSGNTTNLIDHLKRKHRHEYNHVAEMMKNQANNASNNATTNNNENNNPEIPIAIDAINNKQEQSSEIIEEEQNNDVVIEHNDNNNNTADDDGGNDRNQTEFENAENIQVVRVS